MQTVREQLAEELEIAQTILEALTITGAIVPAGLVGQLQVALDRARAEPEEADREPCCDDDRSGCVCYQAGLEAQRERVG